MPKVSPMQTSFGGGEFSPLLNGQVDLDRYRQALEKCLNYIPSLQGGLVRRSGTKFVAEAKTPGSAARLLSFEFSVTQAYILEFGDQYVRFYRNNGQIQSGGSPYEVASPYLAADLFQLRITQSADVLYITHPNYAPRTLSRTGHTAWTLATINFTDGPYLPINTATTSLTPSSFAVGTGVTLTASNTDGINEGQGFKTTDVGRHIRLREGSVWGWVKITGWTSTTVVTVEIKSTLTSTAAKTFFRMGVWSDTTGWPAVVTFHEDRLFFAGNTNYPQRMDGSVTSEYANFAPSGTDGTVLATSAVSFTFNANDVNVVRWVISDEKGLLVGTAGGEWLVRPSSSGEAITPTNITAKRSTKYGSANVQSLQFGKSVLFLQKAGRKVRELTYFFDADGFRATDLTLLAEHATEGGIIEMAALKEPQPILWCVRDDGQLAALTYERDVDSFKVGWHRHVIGGSSDAAGSDAIVESVASIPSADGTRDELWILVQRYVNGAIVRHIEYLMPLFDDSIDQKDGFFVDCGLTYDSPVTITGITRANPAVVTATAHGFTNGDKVLLSDILGLKEAAADTTSALNGVSVLVASAAANTFAITDLDGDNIDTSAYATAYVSGGEAREFISVISGLGHLEGESVDICADGAVQPSRTVSAGAVTLAVPATTVHLGYQFISDGKMLRLNAGAADGTAIGKTQRTHRVGIMLHRSLGLKIGPSFTDLTPITFRKASDKMSRAPALFTGILSEEFEGDYDFENQFCFRQDQPLPSMVLALMPQMHTQDR